MPKSTVEVEGTDAKKVLDLVDTLEELDDVQEVYANFDISDEILSSVAS
jgi:transcriptional/translational regulatory protein YebC/TACO1